MLITTPWREDGKLYPLLKDNLRELGTIDNIGDPGPTALELTGVLRQYRRQGAGAVCCSTPGRL